jgi:hypothetical protein
MTRRQKRRETRDWSVQACGPAKSSRIDLGLELLYRIALPGVRYTRDEIAYFAGCTDGAILLIERKALRKLRNRLLFLKDPVLRDLVRSCFRI